MRNTAIWVLVGFLSCGPLLCAADDPEPAAMTPKQFSDRLTNVIRAVASSYYYEIDAGDLLRWAVLGLYDRRSREIPEEIAGRLAKARDPDKKELRELLTAVAADCGGDLRWCADIACERMLGRLDGRTRLIDDNFVHSCTLRSYWPEGIGVQLAADPATGMLRVRYPYRNGSAYRAGLRSGDLITEILRPKREVPNEPPPRVETFSTKGLSVAKAKEMLSGEPGTPLYLNVRRQGTDKLLHFTVPHEKSQVETVFGIRRGEQDRWDHWLHSKQKIGYLRLSWFNDRTHKDVANVIAALRMQGLKGLVLDLRENVGGLLHAGMHVGKQFVGTDPFCVLRSRAYGEETFAAEGAKDFREFSIACLVNGGTNAMGEVLAACLQDNRRAVIMGERTAGNARIEHLFKVGDDTSLRITGAVFFGPNGKKLDRIDPPGKPSDEWGVTPDKGFELILSTKEHDGLRAHFEKQLEIWPAGHRNEKTTAFKDRQLDLAMRYLSTQAGKFSKTTQPQQLTEADLRESLQRYRATGGNAEWLNEKDGHLIIRRFDRPRERVAFSRLVVPATVKQLTLHGYDFDDDDLKIVSRWTHLEGLDLIHCQDVTDTGLERLSRLMRLKRLVLSDMKITSAGMTHLASLGQLEQLEIQHTRVGDKGVESIRELQKLTKLILAGTGASPAAVKQLQEALPKCEIVHREE